MTPYSVGRCHEVTEGTGDRWEDKPFGRVQGQRPCLAMSSAASVRTAAVTAAASAAA